ncbi:MAG: hypothetical protein HRT90_11675 [Candidatus Margulisbacteria bacterium]|nr:hypothetical protein [Candidatus Margulisiibacteriota bacterium]
MHGGKITSVKIGSEIKKVLGLNSSTSVLPSEKAFSLPNFEILLPSSTDPETRFRIECLAERKNDENMTTYEFSKEAVVKGLQSGILFSEMNECLKQLSFDEHSLDSLKEWAHSYESSEFNEVLLLKVKDDDHFSTLINIPKFLELTVETIPSYGFIVPLKNKPAVKDFLKQFGSTPADSSIANRKKNSHTYKTRVCKIIFELFFNR